MNRNSGSSQNQYRPSFEILVYFVVVLCNVVFVVVEARRLTLASGGLGARPQGTVAGWMFGMRRDDADIQWRLLRAGLPKLGMLLCSCALLSRLAQTSLPFQFRAAWLLTVSASMLLLLHGACAAYVVMLALANYGLTAALRGRRAFPALVWAAHMTVFLAVRAYDGFPFARMHPALAWLDQHRGPMQWHIIYNLLMLRMISFAVDAHWMTQHVRTTPKDTEKPIAAAEPASKLLDHEAAKHRREQHRSEAEYNLLTYLVYVLYPPLYIAGPTATFNDFAAQLRQPLRMPPAELLAYAARVALVGLLLEAVTHTLHMNAMLRYPARRTQLLTEGGAAGVAVVGFWALMFTWLKFLFLWRFTRFCALLEGIQPPENMRRCMCNNFDIEGFWRNWHASFNQWLVRYVYVPLGGRAWRAANVWVVFTFVAVWHDLEMKLLVWGWLMSLFIAPEMLAKWMAHRPLMAPLRQRPVLWRILCGAAAAVNMLVLMSVNMVGYVVSHDGILPLLQQLLLNPTTLALSLLCLFSAVQLMFEIRAVEQLQGYRICSISIKTR